MRIAPVTVLSLILASLLPTLPTVDFAAREHRFAQPIDALSIQFAEGDNDAEVSALIDGVWDDWRSLIIENEQDPTLRESNLVMFPKEVTRVRIRNAAADVELHPISVSQEPTSYMVAATTAITSPRILKRSQWGANESLIIRKDPGGSSSTNGGGNDDNGGSEVNLSERERDCLAAQERYPAEFKTSEPTTKDTNGNFLRWPHRYSTEVKLLVVHHTAQSLKEETRPGVERMRAIYQYHAQNRGWGDIGYHYIIDEKGQIYEGKAGGDFVVGGHAYCNNTGTIGVAMMGNFDEARPPQIQMQSLQWLLKTLADRYQIDVGDAVRYHGMQMPAIVGHKQLLKTDCPGEYVWRTLEQVRDHVRTGDVDERIVFPKLARDIATKPTSTQASSSPHPEPRGFGFHALGSTTIEGRPGGEIIIPLLYRAEKNIRRQSLIGSAWRSNRDVTIAQEFDGKYENVPRSLKTPIALSAGDSVVLRVKVKIPLIRGSSSIRLGGVTYEIDIAGRTVRAGQVTSSYQQYSPEPVSTGASKSSASPSSALSPDPSPPSTPLGTGSGEGGSMIRVKLNDSVTFESVTVTADGLRANNTAFPGKAFLITKNGNVCSAVEEGRKIERSILRIVPNNGVTTLQSWTKKQNRFRGIIECRVIDGQLTIINELSLEDYMAGLAEEPDTEPYEKQRAFAIAARTYAAWYLEDDHRKFPGLPYDGSDSPAIFQAYGGVVFEETNPRWVQAVRDTANKTLRFGGQLIKPPYFSSDDGRTRAPTETGWNDFPFAAIFASKPDPWCAGMTLRGHGVGMSGCGAEGQANEGKKAEEILGYYYPGTTIR